MDVQQIFFLSKNNFISLEILFMRLEKIVWSKYFHLAYTSLNFQKSVIY
jgi:hypothetical protein